MAEYIEREKVIKHLRGYAVARYPSTFYMGLFAAANEISQFPAADVVEVVRCKDCDKSQESFTWGEGWRFCQNNQQHHKESHFCSYGERRNDADN